ncbi:hypothetical protein D3C85_1869140 [compost metagenome]
MERELPFLPIITEAGKIRDHNKPDSSGYDKEHGDQINNRIIHEQGQAPVFTK